MADLTEESAPEQDTRNCTAVSTDTVQEAVQAKGLSTTMSPDDSTPALSPSGSRDDAEASRPEETVPGLEEAGVPPILRKRAKYDSHPSADCSEVTLPAPEKEVDPHFIRKIIRDFQRQASDKQFAVLLLVGVQQLQDIGRMEFVPQNRNGKPVVNNNYVYQPSRTDYGNYIVSRPGLGKDAEVIILEEADELWRTYYNQNKRHPLWLVLYSWFLPSPDCAGRIEQKFPRLQYHGTPLKVAYTAEWMEGLYPRSDAQTCIRRLCAQKVTLR